MDTRSLSQYLADLGFGPIVARAASGLTAGYVPTGYFGMPADVTVSSWLAEWRAEGWDAPHVIVNVGAIDSGFCRTDLACARNSIQHVVDAVGPGHHIWWPQITRFYTHQAEADTWNTALAEFDAARDDFTTWDWPSVLDRRRLRRRTTASHLVVTGRARAPIRAHRPRGLRSVGHGAPRRWRRSRCRRRPRRRPV